MDFTTKSRRTDKRYRVFHIYQHLDGNETFLSQRKYYRKYMQFLWEALYESGQVLLAFVIMPTHYHLLLRCTTVKEMQSLMHRVNTSFGKYVNNRRRMEGLEPVKVFSTTPQYKPVKDFRHLCNELRYMHFNPYKWNRIDAKQPQLAIGEYNEYEGSFNYYLRAQASTLGYDRYNLVKLFGVSQASMLLENLNANEYKWLQFCRNAESQKTENEWEEFFRGEKKVKR